MTKYKETFEQNMGRVDSICTLYVKLKNDGFKVGIKSSQTSAKDGDYLLTDLLRCAVVFMHSSFEEYFRCVLIDWFPVKATKEDLRAIPIAINAGNKPEKIYLSDLADYRGKQIDDVISDSVKESFQLKSFNKKGDIIANAKKIGIDVEKFGGIEDIDAAVHRRHKIVHEADKSLGNNPHLQGITPDKVRSWGNAYRDLVDLIDSEVEKWENEK